MYFLTRCQALFKYWNGVLLITCRKEGTRKDIVTLLLQFGPSPGMILQILPSRYRFCKRVGQRLYYRSTFMLEAGPECDGGSHWNFDWFRILAGDELEEFIERLHVLASVVRKDVHKVCWHPSVNNTSFVSNGLFAILIAFLGCLENYLTVIQLISLNIR